MKATSISLNIHDANLAGYYWQAENTKAVVVLVHGMGEHALRYEDSVIKYLLNQDYSVVAYDNFGHGKTKGKRGHCPNYGALLDSIDAAILKAETIFPNQPLCLYGHSMGGNLVINYTLRRQHKIKTVVATSPFLRLAFQPPKWKMTLGKLMLSIWPSITLPSELEAQAISRDTNEVKRYVEDPLVHDKVSPMFTFPIIEAGEWAITHANNLKTPLLLLHGTGDRIIDYKATEAFAKNTKMAELHVFEGAYHELHHDIIRENMLQTVLGWLDGNL